MTNIIRTPTRAEGGITENVLIKLRFKTIKKGNYNE